MPKIDIINWENKKVGDLELKSEIFEKEFRSDLIHLLVKWFLANKRQGTHKTKTKSEVRGGGRKPFRQKGTGNARQGSIRSPILRGGGVVFGPKPRDYSFSLPKKLKKNALKIALSYLHKEGKIKVVEDMSSFSGKTKELYLSLKSIQSDKALLVDAKVNELFARACKNLTRFSYTSVKGINVYELLKYDNLIMSQDSIEHLYKRCEVK